MSKKKTTRVPVYPIILYQILAERKKATQSLARIRQMMEKTQKRPPIAAKGLQQGKLT